jgi:hypothetical protein
MTAAFTRRLPLLRASRPGKWRAAQSPRFKFDSPVAPLETDPPQICKALNPSRKKAGLDSGPKKTCPVEITFIQGKPFLRLCVGYKQPAKLVAVPADGVAAQNIARKLCANWNAGDKQWANIADARKPHRPWDSNPSYTAFGGMRRR